MSKISKATPPVSKLIGWLLLALVATELLYLYSGIVTVGNIARFLVLALFVVGWQYLRLREIYLLLVCVTLFTLAWYVHRPLLEDTMESLSRAAYLAAFILLMALLREGALNSKSVLEIGTYLTHQPSSRRFVTLFFGGHFFAVLSNLGALSLLAPIIQRGVRSGIGEDEELDEISRVRERRQLVAVMRGFSWFLLWAPTAVTQAVMPTLMSGIDATRLMLVGMLLALLMFAVSWLEDNLRWRSYARRLRAEDKLPAVTKTSLPKRAALRLLLVSLALFGLSISFSALAHVTIVTGIMLAVPLVVGFWIWLQQSEVASHQRAGVVAKRINHITFTAMPGHIREVMFIACAGFIGTFAARLVPAGDVAELIGLQQLDGWIVLWVLSISVWVFGQVGLSPITMAVFLGSLVAELPEFPVDITYAALAIAAGTAICTTGAPFASGVVVLSRATGYSVMTLSWRWNGTYTLISMVVLGLFYVLLTSL